MEQYLTVNVVTPSGLVFDHHAEKVVAITTNGELGILVNHAPIVAPLGIHEVRIQRTDAKDHVNWVAVNSGVIEVRDNVVTIIADSAERARDIDVSRAERARQRAQESIEKAQQSSNVDELQRSRVALHRAINRINVSKHRPN